MLEFGLELRVLLPEVGAHLVGALVLGDERHHLLKGGYLVFGRLGLAEALLGVQVGRCQVRWHLFLGSGPLPVQTMILARHGALINMRTSVLTRTKAGTLTVLLLVLVAAGCDWYGQDDVALRALPYPYAAGVALDGGDEPRCLAEHGVSFAYGGEEVRTTGQDAACSLVDRGRQLWESLAFLRSEREWRARSFFANRLFEPGTPDGGGATYTYKIYAGSVSHLPSHMPPGVAAQVAEAMVYELTAKGAVMVMRGSTDESGPFASVVDHMRREHGKGRVYFVERDRLLAYGFVRRFLDWEAVRADDGVTIRVHAVDDGLAEPWVPTLRELEGITFYTPEPERTRVFVAGEMLQGLVVNPADQTRRGSVTIRSAPSQTSPIDTSP